MSFCGASITTGMNNVSSTEWTESYLLQNTAPSSPLLQLSENTTEGLWVTESDTSITIEYRPDGPLIGNKPDKEVDLKSLKDFVSLESSLQVLSKLPEPKDIENNIQFSGSSNNENLDISRTEMSVSEVNNSKTIANNSECVPSALPSSANLNQQSSSAPLDLVGAVESNSSLSNCDITVGNKTTSRTRSNKIKVKQVIVVPGRLSKSNSLVQAAQPPFTGPSLEGQTTLTESVIRNMSTLEKPSTSTENITLDTNPTDSPAKKDIVQPNKKDNNRNQPPICSDDLRPGQSTGKRSVKRNSSIVLSPSSVKKQILSIQDLCNRAKESRVRCVTPVSKPIRTREAEREATPTSWNPTVHEMNCLQNNYNRNMNELEQYTKELLKAEQEFYASVAVFKKAKEKYSDIIRVGRRDIFSESFSGGN